MTRLWLFLIASLLLCAGSGHGSSRVRPVDARDIHRLVAEQRGRAVLLNFWATWCPPCVVEFPILVEMDETYRDKGLTILSVVDSLDRWIMTSAFLEKYRPGFGLHHED
jgi:thiol-disulfide isomerase/thioredoxin